MNTMIVRSWILMTILLGAVGGATTQERRITAREVVAEIQKQVGVDWKKETVATFKAGNPDTGVTGIAVTMMATMDCPAACIGEGIELRDQARADFLCAYAPSCVAAKV